MEKPVLLLHVCCAPCSTVPIALLAENYRIIGFFYNPNIYPPDEHAYRVTEAKNFFKDQDLDCLVPPYCRREWLSLTRDLSREKEGGERCERCFELRLRKTAEYAVQRGVPYFSTTLTIGPNKPAGKIFPIGEALARQHGINFLAIDFKKKDGFRRSCQMSRLHGMYRQNYCGCEYSFRDMAIRKSHPK